MGVIATEVAALEKQYAEATERASRLEKELAAARARPPEKKFTVGETFASPARLISYYGYGGQSERVGTEVYRVRLDYYQPALLAKDIDMAIADEREACAGMLDELSVSSGPVWEKGAMAFRTEAVEAIRARK